MPHIITFEEVDVVVGCMCPCRIRFYPTDNELKTLAEGRGKSGWWVLVECLGCGSRVAFGESESPHIPLRWKGEKLDIRPAQFRRRFNVRHDHAEAPSEFRLPQITPGPSKTASPLSKDVTGPYFDCSHYFR